MAIYKFRSRYNDSDTNYLLPENQPPRPRSFFAIILCCYRTACVSRARAFTCILVILALITTGHNASSIIEVIGNQSQMQSHWQSFGYVDVPKWKWKNQRAFFNSVHAKDRQYTSPNSVEDIPTWYEENVQVDFICPSESLTGENWWLCSPHHVDSIHGCTVYISGRANDLLREKALQRKLPNCNIHVFDPTRTATIQSENATIKVHHWGFANKTMTTSSNHPERNVSLELKTIADSMRELHHPRVDLLILDCAGCEWFLTVPEINQIIVQADGVRNPQFFRQMSKRGYVLFHRQPLTIFGRPGTHQSMSFLRLRKSFFRY